jgi:hypothetical protein
MPFLGGGAETVTRRYYYYCLFSFVLSVRAVVAPLSLPLMKFYLTYVLHTQKKKKKKKKKKKGPRFFVICFSFLAENELHNVRLFSSMCTYRDSVVFTPYTYAFARNRDFQICQ